jgi:hypothetical protein
MKVKEPLMIPFRTRDGSLLQYTGTLPNSSQDERCNNGRWIWKENFIFNDDIQFLGFYRGCSSAGATFKSLNDGKEYNVFLKDLSDMILADGFRSGIIHGQFTFVKRGQNYGLKFIPT